MSDTASLGHLERLCDLKGKPLDCISARTIERFTEKRLQERGKKPGSTISVASLNKDLRAIKAALNKARKLGYLKSTPDIEFLREPERLPPFITDTDFRRIYEACRDAEQPADHPEPAAWWRGLLTMDILTGWRIGELLSIEWRDVNLDEGYATTRASANRGKRDGVVWLHEVVREMLRGLRQSADPRERGLTRHRNIGSVGYGMKLCILQLVLTRFWCSSTTISSGPDKYECSMAVWEYLVRTYLASRNCDA